MTNFFKRIWRFSSIFKVITLICMIGLLLAYLTPFVHPNTFKLLPFFGLAYPIFLVLTLILLILWALSKSKWALFCLLAILLGGKLHFRMIATGNENPTLPAESNPWNIMSYNVRLFDLYNPDLAQKFKTRDSIFAYIAEVSPDVICFQEFYHQDKPSNFETRDLLMKQQDFRHHHERYAHKLAGRQNFGVTILSKYPMIAKGDVMFEQSGNDDVNYCIYTDVVKNGDTMRIYNVHLQSIKLRNEEHELFIPGQKDKESVKSTSRLILDKLQIAYPKRADQAIKVAEHAKTSPYPVIICGDFNDTPLSYTYHQFNRFLRDAYRQSGFGIGSTYVGKIPAGRIDYIFHSPGLTPTEFKIQKKALSDHLAIHCTLFLTPEL